MDPKLLKYLRKNFLWEVPGRFEAMQFYRAAELTVDPKWPDADYIKFLKRRFNKQELLKKLADWDCAFEENVSIELEKHPEKFPINRCPKCNEITYTPKSERCGECGYTWYGRNPMRSLP